MFRAWDQIIHEAGAAHYMSNGRVKVPLVFHVVHGLRGGDEAVERITRNVIRKLSQAK